MDIQSPIQPDLPKRSNRPILALLLSLSSIFFCCISFMVNNPNGFDAYMENNPVWYIAQALMCVAMLLPLAGAFLGVLSLRSGETNRNLAIAAVVVGILAFLGTASLFGYVMVFIGVFKVFAP